MLTLQDKRFPPNHAVFPKILQVLGELEVQVQKWDTCPKRKKYYGWSFSAGTSLASKYKDAFTALFNRVDACRIELHEAVATESYGILTGIRDDIDSLIKIVRQEARSQTEQLESDF